MLLKLFLMVPRGVPPSFRSGYISYFHIFSDPWCKKELYTNEIC